MIGRRLRNFSLKFKTVFSDFKSCSASDRLVTGVLTCALPILSVVSVPCNQAATFSLAKSFDSMEEYNEFKKTFTNRVDLAGQSLAKDEDSLIASDTPDGTEEVQDRKSVV